MSGPPEPAARTAPPARTGTQHRSPTAWDQMGGLAGLFYSSFPVTVFVVVNSVAGLQAGVWSAVGTAVAFVVLRAVRGQPLRPAVSGFVGIAISSFIAYHTGSAKAYFLPDIWYSLVAFGILALSILIRRPLVGVVWSLLNRAPMTWRKDRPSRLGYDVATIAVAAVFAARFVVQRWLYVQDQTGWLAFAKIAMGYPLTLLGLLVVVWAIRRADTRLVSSRGA